jgi:hypothetical protein
VGFLDPTHDPLCLVFGDAFHDRSRAVKELGQLGSDSVSTGDLFDDSCYLDLLIAAVDQDHIVAIAHPRLTESQPRKSRSELKDREITWTLPG